MILEVECVQIDQSKTAGSVRFIIPPTDPKATTTKAAVLLQFEDPKDARGFIIGEKYEVQIPM